MIILHWQGVFSWIHARKGPKFHRSGKIWGGYPEIIFREAYICRMGFL